jgi:hypothetical protein
VRLGHALFADVGAESLAVFRIAVGAVLTWEVSGLMSGGWIERYWIEPDFHFTYTLFAWLSPLPGEAMVWLFYLLLFLTLLITVGLFQRPAAALFTIGFGYAFLLEESTYLNHLYLMCLIALLLVFVPANRVWSIDALLRRPTPRAPAWALWLLRFQVGVPYFFGGLAKINPDWLQGEPLRQWLAAKTWFPVIGPLFTRDWMVAIFSYGGLVIDLLAVPLLLWRRTRSLTYLTLILFHLANARLFNIGIFPWVMMAATAIFFEADWPRRLWRDLRTKPLPTVPAVTLGAVVIGALAVWIGEADGPVPLLAATLAGAVCAWLFLQPAALEGEAAIPTTDRPRNRRLVLTLLASWALLQALLPLRHFLYPGRSSWTEEGHRFAWHMMLRAKSGTVLLRVTDPASGQVTSIDVGEVLPAWQYHQMTEAPHMIHQFARYTASRFAAIGYPDVEVRAVASVSLNGRPRQLLIDPAVDLAALPRSLAPASYVVPLDTPLPTRRRSD